MFRIVHVFDDDKFIDVTIRIFEEVYPGKSLYLVLKQQGEPFQYVKSPLAEAFDLSQPETFDRLSDLASDGAVFFLHALNFAKQRIVNALPESTVKVWFIWGFDLYGAWKPFHRDMFEPITQNLQARNSAFSKKERLKTGIFAHKLLKFSRSRLLFPQKLATTLESYFGADYWHAIHKIDIAVTVVPEESEYVRKLGVNPDFAPFSYGFLEELLLPGLTELNGRNILVGNSGDPTNNHLDTFARLETIDLGQRKIIVPLSYGGKEAYRETVIREGYRIFGDNFMPLTGFMAKDDYTALLASCDTVIFNHIRQQGVGNLVVMGYLGAKIFLNPKSSVFTHFRNRKAEVFSITALSTRSLDEKLPDAQKQHNRDILTELYSHENVLNKTRKLLDIVSKKLKTKK